MSAFAISGLVLAIIPICQEAIIKRAATMNDAREHRFLTELSQFVRALRLHQDRLELSLRKLLRPVVKSEDIDEMIRNPGGPRWKESQLRQQLFDAHGSLYNTFESEVLLICNTITKIAGMLGLCKPNTTAANLSSTTIASMSSNSGLNYNYPQRLRMASDFNEIRGLFKQLEWAQNNLDKLIDQNEKRPSSPDHSTAVPSGYLQVLRKRAMALYTVLSGLSHCTEHATHCAHLRLEYRELAERGLKIAKVQEGPNRFKIALSEPWGWQLGEAFVHEEANGPSPAFHPAGQTSVDEGEHICPVVERHKKKKVYLGLCINGTTEAKLEGVYHSTPKQQSIIDNFDNLVDLGTILGQTDKSQPLMGRGERMSLAVVLTSSIWQLHTTHWLMDTWSAKDIVFLPRDSSSDIQGIDAASPYLVHHFGPSVDATKDSQRTKKIPVNKRAALLNLGITLVELWHGRRLEYEPSQDEQIQGDRDLLSKGKALQDSLHWHGAELPKSILQAASMCRSLDSQNEEKIASELCQMVEDLSAVSKLFNT